MTEFRLECVETALTPTHKAAFRALNERWLIADFAVEPVDEAVFANPEGKILDTGGSLFFLWSKDTIVGTCALKNEGEGIFELTKMAVDPAAQGTGAGQRLAQAVIDKFVASGGQQLYLETHSILQPAIRLYKRCGFVDQGHRKPGSEYSRSEVYMIWQAGA